MRIYTRATKNNNTAIYVEVNHPDKAGCYIVFSFIVNNDEESNISRVSLAERKPADPSSEGYIQKLWGS